ncbi:MAG: hypothetical protein D6711_03725 [Chloroflexi bacterium]|nr:MAG: hypothetical protein D6711_03725 [Chloroflexota bacterium]
MKKNVLFLFILLLWGGIQPATAAPINQGISVTCNNGVRFDNGVAVTVVQMRSGFSYTATAIGLNDFDPILAVVDENGQGLCSDDTTEAARFSVNLPTTGRVTPSLRTAQIEFSNNSGMDFADITLVVGSVGNQPGEFVLVLDGMALTVDDNAGDPFTVQITPDMIASGIPVTTYMISVVQGFDPLIALIDQDYNLLVDNDGNPITCDDAGNVSNCWGDSASLANSSVSRPDGRTLAGGQYDAMLSIPLQTDMEGSYLNFLMRSYEMSSLGNYVIAFHIGTGAGTGASNTPGNNLPTVPSGNATPSNEVLSNSGMTVTCADGSTFENGVPITVIQMRAGYSYTATAIGLNGFDPVLAVLDENGNGLCNDDNADAADFSANLPTTGQISPSLNTAQIEFYNNSGVDFANITLVVGGRNSSSGEVLLVLDGMALTVDDNTGDPFGVQITPGMIASGVPLSVYMISVVDGFDPLIAMINEDYDFIADNNDNLIACDDAGNVSNCWGDSASLARSYVSRPDGRRLSGGQYDAMLSLPLSPDFAGLNAIFLMLSYEMSSLGNYVIAFHLGIGQ